MTSSVTLLVRPRSMRRRLESEASSTFDHAARRATPGASSPAARRRMLANRRKDTSAELALRRALRESGLRYRVDYKLPGTRRRADIAFPKAKIAVFVDGCFWHACPQHGTWPRANAVWWREKLMANRMRDLDTTERLSKAGWTVMRFWEHEDAMAAARSVAKAVEG